MSTKFKNGGYYQLLIGDHYWHAACLLIALHPHHLIFVRQIYYMYKQAMVWFDFFVPPFVYGTTCINKHGTKTTIGNGKMTKFCTIPG